MSIAVVISQKEEYHLYCDACINEEMGFLRVSSDGYIHRCDNCGSTIAEEREFPFSENYPIVYDKV